MDIMNRMDINEAMQEHLDNEEHRQEEHDISESVSHASEGGMEENPGSDGPHLVDKDTSVDCLMEDTGTDDPDEDGEDSDCPDNDEAEEQQEEGCVQEVHGAHDNADSDDDSLSSWPDDLTKQIITLWKQTRYLYDPSMKWYHSTPRKEAGYAEIAKTLDVEGMYVERMGDMGL